MELKLIFIISVIVSLLVLILAWFNYLLNKESEAYKILKEITRKKPYVWSNKRILTSYKFDVDNREIVIRKIPLFVHIFNRDFSDKYYLIIDGEFADVNGGDTHNKKRLFDYVEELFLNQK